MKRGNYPTDIKVLLEDDTEVTVTLVAYYPGFRGTLEEPAEPEELTILKVEDSDGVEIEGGEGLITHDLHLEVEEEFFEGQGEK